MGQKNHLTCPILTCMVINNQIGFFILLLQKSRIPQVQGIKAAAVVVYRKALITQEMRCPRLSLKVNNTAKQVFLLYAAND
jgi:hypothetical protein